MEVKVRGHIRKTPTSEFPVSPHLRRRPSRIMKRSYDHIELQPKSKAIEQAEIIEKLDYNVKERYEIDDIERDWEAYKTHMIDALDYAGIAPGSLPAYTYYHLEQEGKHMLNEFLLEHGYFMSNEPWKMAEFVT